LSVYADDVIVMISRQSE